MDITRLLTFLIINRVLTPTLDTVFAYAPPIVHDITLLETPIQHFYGFERLTLECKVSGHPVPTIDWSINGVTLSNGQGNGSGSDDVTRHEVKATLAGSTLKIDPANSETDSGRYRCIATNPAGSSFMERFIRIKVMGRFKQGSRGFDEPAKFYPMLGEMFKLDCPPHTQGYGTHYLWGVVDPVTRDVSYYHAGRPNPRVFPTQDGGLMYSHVTEDDVRVSRAEGGLRCILYNSGFYVTSHGQILWEFNASVPIAPGRPILLSYMSSQMVALLNRDGDSEFSMVCAATGYPQPEISWTFGTQAIQKSSSVDTLGNGMELYIKNVSQASIGVYECTAKNRYGEDTRRGFLDVHYPPYWLRRLPHVTQALIAGAVTLVCEATSSPQATYSWYYNGRVLSNGTRIETSNGFLKIRNLNAEDGGVYLCLASNELDSATTSTFLDIRPDDHGSEDFTSYTTTMPVFTEVVTFSTSKDVGSKATASASARTIPPWKGILISVGVVGAASIAVILFKVIKLRRKRFPGNQESIEMALEDDSLEDEFREE